MAVAALIGAGLSLTGTPSLAPLPGDAVVVPEPASEPAPVRTPVGAPAGPAPQVAAETPRHRHVPVAPADLPPEVRLCWSPTARRVLGEPARHHLEQLGARVRVFTESDRGARGRLFRGEDDLALIAGAPTNEEFAHGITSRVLGYHVLVAVVHESNPLTALPRHAVRAALIGEVTDWQHLGGGRPGAIVVAGVAEDPFSDQATSLVLLRDRLARDSQRLATDDEVRAFVAGHPDALGLCSLAAVCRAPSGVRVLLVDNVAPSAAAYAAGRYPFASPVRLLARDARCFAWLAAGFAGDALSPLP